MKNLHNKLAKDTAQRAEVYLTEQFKALIKEAEESVEQLEPKEIDLTDEKLILIDVREPEEFGSGYINATNSLTIPRGKLEFLALNKIAKQYGMEAEIVTYCLKGPRGALAASVLQKMGFSNVKNLKGGILNWLEEGYTIQSYLGELTLANRA
jgi:rhodanese-related sulfurtransferase